MGTDDSIRPVKVTDRGCGSSACRAAFLAAASVLALLNFAHSPAASVVLEVQLPDAPEGVTFNSDGRLFATLYNEARVVEVHRDGRVSDIARLPEAAAGVAGNAVGIEAGADGWLYVAYRQRSALDANELTDSRHIACRDAAVTRTGVYRVHPDRRDVEPVATRAQGWPVCFPNDLAIDSQGDLYVSDFYLGGIWRLRPGQAPQLWSDDVLLGWAPAPWAIAPAGVNAIALNPKGDALLAGTVGNPMILQLSLRNEQTAGAPDILQRDGGPTDGMAVASDGTIFTSEILRSEIWALSPDGRERHLVANRRTAPLDGNASLALYGNRLCVANVGFPEADIRRIRRTVVCLDDIELPWRKQP